MTRPSRLLSLAAVATLALAGCGGSTPTTAPAASETPAVATPSPAAPSAAPTAPPTTASPAAEGPDLGSAAAALDSIRKYALSLSVSGMMPTAAGSSAITMVGLVDQDADAYQFDMSGFEVPGLPVAELSFIVIGPDAWVDLGTGTFLKQPGGGASFDQMRAGLSPGTLLGQFSTSGLDVLPGVDEDRNGVATTHYHASAADTPALVPSIGEDGVMDLWVAKDGGYLVSMDMEGTIDVEGTATPVAITIDLTRINDDTISIEAPN